MSRPKPFRPLFLAGALVPAIAVGAIAPAASGEVPGPAAQTVSQGPSGIMATTVSAKRGVAAFSVFDQKTRRYRLALWDGKRVRTLSAPPRESAFDASVGFDSKHRTVVSYTRCKEPVGRYFTTETGTPNWASQTGCTIRVIDVKTGRSRTRAIETRQGGSAWLPVIAGKSLVYARLRSLGRVNAGKARGYRYRFEIVRRDGNGRTHRLRGGTHPDFVLTSKRGDLGDLGDKGAGATSLDYDGRRVVYGWERSVESESRCDTDNESRGGASVFETNAYLEFGGRRRTIAVGCSSSAPGLITSVGLSGGRTTWLRTPFSDTPQATIESRVGTGTTTAIPVTVPAGQAAAHIAVDGTTSWLALTSDTEIRNTLIVRSPGT